MQFSEYQSRLWHRMLKSIECFRKGEIQYYDLVSELEGSLDAGDFQDRKLVEQWYDHWTPLEILRARNGNNVTIEDVDKYLSDMKSFLMKVSLSIEVHNS